MWPAWVSALQTMYSRQKLTKWCRLSTCSFVTSWMELFSVLYNASIKISDYFDGVRRYFSCGCARAECPEEGRGLLQ